MSSELRFKSFYYLLEFLLFDFLFLEKTDRVLFLYDLVRPRLGGHCRSRISSCKAWAYTHRITAAALKRRMRIIFPFFKKKK